MIPDRTLDAVTEGPAGITDHGSAIVAAGPAAVDLFRIIAVRHALKFEVEHPGMKMTRGSTLSAANRILGTTYRRKAQALEHLDAVLDAARGEGVDS